MTKKILSLMMMLCMGIILTACSSDDNDEPIEVTAQEAMLQGKWKCTDCDVSNVKAAGLDLPDYVINIMKEAIVSDMKGYVLTIPDFSTGKVKLQDNVLIFPGAGIKYTIKHLTDKHMDVTYETSNSASGFTIGMTVEASFDKIN